MCFGDLCSEDIHLICIEACSVDFAEDGVEVVGGDGGCKLRYGGVGEERGDGRVVEVIALLNWEDERGRRVSCAYF